jgi:hypothetical protein
VQRKIQLSGFSTYPDGSLSELIRISGVLLYAETKYHKDGDIPPSYVKNKLIMYVKCIRVRSSKRGLRTFKKNCITLFKNTPNTRNLIKAEMTYSFVCVL